MEQTPRRRASAPDRLVTRLGEALQRRISPGQGPIPPTSCEALLPEFGERLHMIGRVIACCAGALWLTPPAVAAEKHPHLKIIIETVAHQRYRTVGDW